MMSVFETVARLKLIRGAALAAVVLPVTLLTACAPPPPPPPPTPVYVAPAPAPMPMAVPRARG